MKLINNAGVIAKRAYSMWAIYLGIICLILPDAIFYVFGRDTNPRVWFFAALALLLWGAFSRLIEQKKPDGSSLSASVLASAVAVALFIPAMSVPPANVPAPPAGGVVQMPRGIADAGDFLEVAVPFIGRWEGLRLTAYRDIVGVWTVCYGETKGVKAGDSYTRPQCDAMLAREIIEYRTGVHRYFTPQTLGARLPRDRDLAFTSLAYNAGVSGVGRSTATRRLNAGDVAGACDALTWWNKAGGRVIRGLVNRRTDERDLCLRGVA